MEFLLQTGIRGTVLILLVLCFRRLARDHVAKRTMVFLWLAVIFRLLLPFSLPVPQALSERLPAVFLSKTHSSELFSDRAFSGGMFFDGVFSGIMSPGGMFSDRMSPDGMSPGTMSPGVMSPGGVLNTGDAALPAPGGSSGISGIPASGMVTAVWLLTAGLFGGAIILRHLACLRLYRESLPLCSDAVNRWQCSHRLFRTVSVRTSCHVSGPLTYGLFRPVILLPAEPKLLDEELSCVLEHEWIHIKRWDVAVKYLMCLALCVYWFHPLVWVMAFFLNRDIELACDEEVLRKRDCNARKKYAVLLLKLAEKRQTARPVGACFTKHSELEERIQAMIKMKKRTWKSVVFTAAIVLSMTPAFTAAARDAVQPETYKTEALSKSPAGAGAAAAAPNISEDAKSPAAAKTATPGFTSSGTAAKADPAATATTTATTAAAATGDQIADLAKKHLGNPYRYGGTDLETGVDSSGFVQAIYKKSGIDLPRTMKEQAEAGTVVALDAISAGDLIFYGKSGEDGSISPAHVAIYTGDGQVVHASNAKDGIKMSETGYREIWKAIRVIK